MREVFGVWMNYAKKILYGLVLSSHPGPLGQDCAGAGGMARQKSEANGIGECCFSNNGSTMQILLIANLVFSGVLIVTGAAAGIYFYLLHLRRRRGSRLPGNPANDYAVRQDWSRSTGTLNYSSFIYFDVDRDGRYGLGDRPMAGIKVRLRGANGLSSLIEEQRQRLCQFWYVHKIPQGADPQARKL